MATVMMTAVVSLDGFIARPDDMPGPLFDWYSNGDEERDGLKVSDASYAYAKPIWDRCTVLVCGRRLFELTNGWEGIPPIADSAVVVTHQPPTDWEYPDAPFQFVDSIEAGMAKAHELATGDDDIISLTAGDVGSQALAAGLVDEVHMDLVPVVLGDGKRYFVDDHLEQVMLDDPLDVVQGDRVLHLRYKVSTTEDSSQ